MASGQDEHPFESRLVEDEDARAMPQSQVLDPMLYTDKTIPEFDEQDYTSHRNVYVAVHVPRKSSKHRHRSKKRRSTQGHHSRNQSLNEPSDYHSNEHGYQGDVPNNEGQMTPKESTGQNFQDAEVPPQHKALHGTVSDATPSSSRRSSLNGRPRYHKSHSLGADLQRHTELNIPEVIREPRTPCDPCDRVKFLIGADDADSSGCHDPTVHTIFTELEELKYDENDHAKMEWKETARWVKFEEDVEEGGNKWSKPHVATLSLHSLFELRSCLLKGTVILDMRADNLVQISDYVLDNLVCTGQLEEANREKVRSALLQRHKHLNSRKESENKILESIRSLGDIGRLNSKQGGDSAADVVSNNSHRFGSFTKSMSNVPSLAGSRGNSRRGSVQVPPGTNLTDVDGGGSGSLNRLEEEGTHDSEQDLTHLKKSTANFMKKIPPGSEASNVLVGEVDFLSHSIIAFVRLSEGHILGDLTEVPIPTRFLFILLGPTGNQERYHEIGRSIATLMSDEVFHEVAYRARNRGDLLAGIDEFLDKVTVLPPGEWDPQIRLEPPSKIPSQEERKQSKDTRRKSVVSAKWEDERTPPVKWSKIPFLGLKDDLLRCYSFYRSDLSNALNWQFLSSLILIYFANIAIVFVFGAFFSDMTQGAMGVTEMILAVAIGNFVFSIFSGQPLIILGATGPTVVFEKIVFAFCNQVNIPFLEFRFWIGLYTALFIIALVGLNSSAVTRLFTRFTGEIFSALISFVFMFEALRSLWSVHLKYPYGEWILRPTIRRRCDCYQFPDMESLEATNLTNATRLESYWDDPNCSLESHQKFVGRDCPGDLFEDHDVFLMSVILFFGTFLVCFYLMKFRNSKFFRTIIRRIVSDFGVLISVVIWICVDVLADVNTPKLQVPNVFNDRFFTSQNRTYLFIDPLGNGLPHWAIAAALIPALLATFLLFVDQHITALIVNKKDNKLKKGPGYHVDMFLVGVMIFFHSVMGLPWVVGATLLSITHVQSLHIYGSSGPPGEAPKFLGVREQRVTLFFMSVLVGLSVMLYSVVDFVPLPVLYGLLFYLGVASLYGVQFLQRFKLLFIPNKYKPDYAYLRRVPNVRIHVFTIIQVVLLVLLIIVQGVDVLRVVFPVFVIGLMFIRWLLGFCFPRKDLQVLDDPLPEGLYCRKCEGGHCTKKDYDVTLEEGSSNSASEVEVPDNVVTEEPLASDQNLLPRESTRQRRSSEFNITHEVDKCDIWRNMVNDLDVPYSSPRRAARYDSTRPSITVTSVERHEDWTSPLDGTPEEQVPLEPLDSAQLDREESTARMLHEQEGSGSSPGRSKACRKLFTSTEV